MVAIDHEKPLLGQPLNDVLTWQRASDVPPAATASRRAASTSGGWCWKRFITRWCSMRLPSTLRRMRRLAAVKTPGVSDRSRR